MERYGQYRDRGSGIAPFLPIAPPPTSPLWLPWHLLLFSIRVPLLIFAWFIWLTLISHIPAGSGLRKANQWCLLGIPGVWWVDLQIDGVRRGSVGRFGGSRRALPQPGTVVSASWTSPLDVLYLAAIFDPIFTLSYAGEEGSRKGVRVVSQETALAASVGVQNPLELLSGPGEIVSLSDLLAQNPRRIIVVFPEGTTSNGRGILRLVPSSLTSAAPQTKIYPMSIKYTPQDIVTPIPGWMEVLRFIWRLNSSQNHTIRVRIGAPHTKSMDTKAVDGDSAAQTTARGGQEPPTSSRSGRSGGFEANFFDTLQRSPPRHVESDDPMEGRGDNRVEVSPAEQKLVDAVADDLARLGRVKRVDLGVEEKERFVQAWNGAKGARERSGRR
ncbi:hypothetical protein KC360_g2407 [Hortaea werneckii]|nr:hypothetical protein KC361_g1713 [Hortaea werneckii]KAI6886512.1 hypothetical protein KC325_g2805 [Hortaea werneckii]KAI6996593.1 hypothetical protein KC359_g3457 [Hortaea werneckii]KAI7149600.1 hypothetical protein KC344_g931 [Hortaea werneckii]KAI7177262.1 hypothetical protein KC360_g2407 [Hortaea werneckii]